MALHNTQSGRSSNSDSDTAYSATCLQVAAPSGAAGRAGRVQKAEGGSHQQNQHRGGAPISTTTHKDTSHPTTQGELSLKGGQGEFMVKLSKTQDTADR